MAGEGGRFGTRGERPAQDSLDSGDAGLSMKISGGDITVWLSRVSDKVHVEMGDVVGLQISTREAGDVTILDLRGRATLDNGESELLSTNYVRCS